MYPLTGMYVHHITASAPVCGQDYDDEWAENPDLTSTWGITAAFKRRFDEGFQVLL